MTSAPLAGSHWVQLPRAEVRLAAAATTPSVGGPPSSPRWRRHVRFRCAARPERQSYDSTTPNVQTDQGEDDGRLGPTLRRSQRHRGRRAGVGGTTSPSDHRSVSKARRTRSSLAIQASDPSAHRRDAVEFALHDGTPPGSSGRRRRTAADLDPGRTLGPGRTRSTSRKQRTTTGSSSSHSSRAADPARRIMIQWISSLDSTLSSSSRPFASHFFAQRLAPVPRGGESIGAGSADRPS